MQSPHEAEIMAILEYLLISHFGDFSLSLPVILCSDHKYNIIEDKIIYLESKQSFLTSQDNKGMVFEYMDASIVLHQYVQK